MPGTWASRRVPRAGATLGLPHAYRDWNAPERRRRAASLVPVDAAMRHRLLPGCILASNIVVQSLRETPVRRRIGHEYTLQHRRRHMMLN